MLEFIDNVEVDLLQKHTMPDALIDQQLEEADSALSVIGEAQFDVRLRVSSTVAEVFYRRKHLPDQKSTLLEDGSLLVTSTISSYHDIDPEIKSWFPHIEILEPKEYRKMFLLELERYREQFKEEIEALTRG
jgi:predicted DNA-binding transcriptional regulator YafY